jgi:hypothetical protein
MLILAKTLCFLKCIKKAKKVTYYFFIASWLDHAESSERLVVVQRAGTHYRGVWYRKKKDNPTSFRRHVAFPSRQFLQVPGSLVVCPCRNVLGRVAVNLFGLTVCLLSHYGSHSAPWAQQAFTCCADLNDESALFFGWSEPYSRHTSINAFIEKFCKMLCYFWIVTKINTQI